MDKTNIVLNKIYRAVRDGGCPNCGDDMEAQAYPSNEAVQLYVCKACRFMVTVEQMRRMRVAVSEWGTGLKAAFDQWVHDNP